MFSKILSTTAVALAASSLVSAQTSSLCNPTKGQKCPDNKALPPSVEVDFTKGASDVFTLADATEITYDDENGAVFSIGKDGLARTITSKNYLFFGKVDVWLKASFGTGIVTSLVLQSDDLDEIDWEWLGGDTTQVQTNYFSKGDDSTYDRGGFSPVASPQETWHKYSIDWTNTTVTWLIDDKTVRVLTKEEAKGGATFPQSPMQIKLGTWVGGHADAAEGTIEWAGGLTNLDDAPFIGYYKKVSVVNYSNGVKGATAYKYGDKSGTMESIIIKTDGSSSGGDDDSSSSSSSASSSSASSTKSSKSSTSESASKTSSSSVVPTMSSNTTSTAGSTGTGSTGTGGATMSPTSSGPTTAPSNAAGNLAATLGNSAAMGVAIFLASLVL